jgi:ribosome biogenesis GTPase A
MGIVEQPERNSQGKTAAGVRELLELTDGLLEEGSRAVLSAGLERLEAGQFNLVVLGEFKRGKSSLVNALLERELLPTGVLPLTSAVTVISGAEQERLLVGFGEGEERERPLDELATFITEAGNPENTLGVESVAIELDAELLEDGLRLIDTPGVGSSYEHNTETALGFLPHIDAAVMVLAADQPLSAAERELARKLAELTPRPIFVLNRIDLLGTEEIDAARRFVLNQLTDEGRAGGVELFCLSARQGTGVDRLAAHLRELARGQGRLLTRTTVRARGAGLAAEATALLELERAALQMPLAELEERVALFELSCADLMKARRQATDLLDVGLRRLLEEVVNEPLRELREEAGASLMEGLVNHARVTSTLPPRRFATRLEEWTQSAVRHAFGEAQRRISGALVGRVVELQSEHAARIEALLGELDSLAGEAFGTEVALGHLRQVGVRGGPRLTFKLEDPQDMLEVLLSGLSRFAPGGLGRLLVRRSAEEHLNHMVDRHCGRLRCALTEQAEEAVTAYQRELAQAVEQLVGEVRSAAKRAHSEHLQGERQVSERLTGLERQRFRLEQIAAELGR